jgi:predicted membrane protein
METPDNDFKNELKQKIRRQAQEAVRESGERRRSSHPGRIFAGLILVGIGVVLLSEQFGVYIPSWIFTWKMLLIAIGFFIGAKHGFRHVGWIFPVIVGSVFLIDDLYPELSFRHYIWPLAIISIGLLMILRPRRRRHDRRRSWTRYEQPAIINDPGADEEVIDSVAAFGSVRKNVITKNFKGGEVTSSFGGTDLNLLQADFTGTITLEITNVFGGTKLIVPPHWNIKSEVVCVFGGVDDKRPAATENVDPLKVLRLVGTCVFGGIEITSHTSY